MLERCISFCVVLMKRLFYAFTGFAKYRKHFVWAIWTLTLLVQTDSVSVWLAERGSVKQKQHCVHVSVRQQSSGVSCSGWDACALTAFICRVSLSKNNDNTGHPSHYFYCDWDMNAENLHEHNNNINRHRKLKAQVKRSHRQRKAQWTLWFPHCSQECLSSKLCAKWQALVFDRTFQCFNSITEVLNNIYAVNRFKKSR